MNFTFTWILDKFGLQPKITFNEPPVVKKPAVKKPAAKKTVRKKS
jgi:hypothetical protein